MSNIDSQRVSWGLNLGVENDAHVTNGLSVIYPVGNWALNKRELHVLISRLKK